MVMSMAASVGCDDGCVIPVTNPKIQVTDSDFALLTLQVFANRTLHVGLEPPSYQDSGFAIDRASFPLRSLHAPMAM
jgi:hypothetical protein